MIKNNILKLTIIFTISVITLSGCASNTINNNDSNVTTEKHSINIITDGNGSVNKSPDKNEYETNASVTITATPDDGWIFDHWEGNITGTENPRAIIVDSNLNIEAFFTVNQLLVNSTTPSDSSVDAAADIDYIYIYFNNTLGIGGQQAASAITITPSPGFYPGWYVDDNYIRISLLSGILDFEQTYQISIDNTKVWDIEGNSLEQPYEFSFTIEKDTYPPDTPSLGITSENNTATLNWTTVYDNPADGPRARHINHYNIYRKKNDERYANIDVVDKSETNYIDNNLNPGTYHYYVTAVDDYGNESSPSNEVDITVN